VVRRPPLNAYLKMAVVRDDDDAVVCEDPEKPGATKTITMKHLLDNKDAESRSKKNDMSKAKEKMNRAIPRKKLSTGQRIADANHDKLKKEEPNSNSKNKKEIPVPTITTVKRYDTDVPPDYAIPPSYVRNICPTYEEVGEFIEYNVDAEDERWWRENREFGPFAKAKIVAEGEERSPESKKSPSDGAGCHGKAKRMTADSSEKETTTSNIKVTKQRTRNTKTGKFAKKSAFKKIVDDTATDDAKDDAMEVDETKSDASNVASHMYTIEQVLILNPRYLYSQHSTRYLIEKYNPKLPLHLLELMMDILEKATGFESIVTKQQAEEVLVRKIPELEDIFGPLTVEDRRLEEEDDERHLVRWLKIDAVKSQASKKQPSLPALAQPITLPAAIHQVYDYWVAKRSKLRKPLLRRYWPPTAATDTNPHQVFRVPNKEKRRLRKKKQNDAEAYKKMKQLKSDFERVRALCELVMRREEASSTLVELTNEYFEERLHGWVDTTGVPRQIKMLNKRKIASAVLNVPKYFDDGPIVKVRGGKKRKQRSLHHSGSWNGADGRSPSPVPPHAAHQGALPPFPGGAGGLHRSNTHPPTALANLHPGMKHPPPHPAPMMPMPHPPRNVVAAGHDGGLPAPNFLQPLATRESHTVANWENEVPSVPSYVDGSATTDANRFKHRPRLGRGGRIIIDRVPLPSSSPPRSRHGAQRGGIAPPPPPTVITYGSGMGRSGYDVATLGVDGPNYNIHSSPGKLAPDRNFEQDGGTTGADAATAPKAPPARCLSDLLPQPMPLGDPKALSRRLEEICAMGLIEDYQTTALATATAPSTAGTVASAVSASSSKGIGSSSAVALGAEEMEEVLVPMEDWMEAPEGLRIYGAEKFVIGPI